MTTIDLTLNGNNKFLRKMFPKTKVTKTKLTLGELDPKFLTKSIKSVEQLQFDYSRFELVDLDLEGQFDDWDVLVKINVYA